MPGVEIRKATSADVPAMMSVINEAYVVEQFFIKGGRVTAEDMTHRMTMPNSAFLVAMDPATPELAGTVFTRTSGERGYFGLLAVLPQHQGRGVSVALIGAAEQYCRDAGCEWLDIDVVDLRTELPPFYRKFGFEVTGTLPFPDPHKLSQPAHLITMAKRLRGRG